MALHLPIGPLKTRSGLKPVPRCEPSTYQPISRWHNHCAIGAGITSIKKKKKIPFCTDEQWGGGGSAGGGGGIPYYFRLLNVLLSNICWSRDKRIHSTHGLHSHAYRRIFLLFLSSIKRISWQDGHIWIWKQNPPTDVIYNNNKRKIGNVLIKRRTQHNLFTVIWRRT